MMPTKFYGSQVGSAATKPHAYTGSPGQLLRHDILTALQNFLLLPTIVFPLRPWDAKELCELYPSPGNLWSMFLHVILVLMQLPFILSIPFWLLFPMWWVVGGVIGFMLVNQAVCFLLNGSRLQFQSNPELAEAKDEHKHEQWIFLNGVAVGHHWLQGNLDRLALTFGRPILGVHNRTNGILFDVIQCLIQRNFTYTNEDVRVCYSVIKSTLYRPELTKVIFILHSQGGIEGGLIIDWLLQEVPQDLLAKLEVYTFGNAANHFNNPHLHLLSQNAAVKNPDKPSTTKTITQVHYHEPVSLPHADSPKSIIKHSRSSKQESTSGKTIRYIEHYAHSRDFVAQWGVLHFVSASALSAAEDSPTTSRFMGRVFERKATGHQFNQHYLQGMLPLKRSSTPDGGIVGTGFEGVDEDGEFMASILDLTPDDNDEKVKEGKGEKREGVKMSYQTAHGEPIEESEENEVLLRDISPTSTFRVLDRKFRNEEQSTKGKASNTSGEKLVVRVKDLSRLFLYVNGGSPKMDETDLSIARMATL